jgi:hypothetical protein
MVVNCCSTSALDITEWIEIGSVLINGFLAFWIVRTIQDKLANRRVLKDHFISEIKELREQYKTQLNNLYLGKCTPKELLPWFKLMNIKITDLMKVIGEKYKIDKDILKAYQIELRTLVTESDDFNESFKNNNPILFSNQYKTDIIQFQQKNNSIFNKIIVQINDHD